MRLADADPLDRPFPMSGQEGALYGCIVTFENDDGRTLVLHRAGTKRAAITDAFETATALDASFRIVSISTPQTIYTDLQGARMPASKTFGLQGIQLPEMRQAATVPGGVRMLHPRLRGSSAGQGTTPIA